MNKIPTSFSVSIIDLAPAPQYQRLTRARMRAFYKGDNKNGTFITDEIAANIIRGGAGSPIVGTYDYDLDDFTAHNRNHSTTKSYGFVPFESNFAWEKHLDADGVEREYATFDVYLWTSYYKEASKIVGKSQSMELDPTTIDGHWTIDPQTGQSYFSFTHADLLGFCVLGENVEPCFEGAAFFSIQDYEFVIKNLITFKKNLFENGGMSNMQINFCGEHPANYMELFNKLNPQAENAENFEIQEIILDMSENSVTTFACGSRKVKKYSYTKDEANEYSFTTDSEEDFSRYAIAADPTPVVNNELDQLKQDYAELQTRLAAAEAALDVSKTDYANATAQLTEAQTKLGVFEAENKNLINEKKKALLASYSTLLDVEATKNLDLNNFSLDELESYLAKEYVKQTVNFSKTEKVRVPIVNQNERPLIKLLSGYII